MAKHSFKDVIGEGVYDTPLDQWLRAREMSSYAFAKKLGMNPRTTEAWAKGRSLPDLVNAFRIQEATDFGVTPEMWMGTELFKLQWTHATATQEEMREQKSRDNHSQYLRRLRANANPRKT